jgi:cytidylate kinase
MSDRVRIHKALADAGVASRRRAEVLVSEGRVTVNGVTAGVGQLVDAAHDELAVDGRAIAGRQPRVYLVLAKPAGVTSTVGDRHAARTVLDLVPAALRGDGARIYPVGRLDRESEGLLLLTNDGDWAQRMLHPSHGVEREYAVGLDLNLSDAQQQQLGAGVAFEEGRGRIVRLSPATSADVRQLGALIGDQTAGRLSWYRVTLRQGMKRQLRRMFTAVGAPVRRLVRIRFGTLRLYGMALGDVRPLSQAERRQLNSLVTAEEAPEGLVVSVDGPGGSGKSSVGAGAAARLGYRFCDTGVLYRGLTWLALQAGADIDDPAALVPLVAQLELTPDAAERYVHLRVDGAEITDQLHTAAVDREVSRVSRHAEVRAQLLPVQRALAARGRIIMAGRDIGSIVLPHADPKIYLEVPVTERARRRAAERGELDDSAALASIEDDLRRRDVIDSTRATAPLRVPPGATIVNTEGNTLDQTIIQVAEIIERRSRELGEASGE